MKPLERAILLALVGMYLARRAAAALPLGDFSEPSDDDGAEVVKLALEELL
jgi:hypothetical protein